MPPRLARLLAVVLAVVLVVGAFVVRAVLADDDGEVETAGRDRGESSGAVRVVCDEDLGAVCDALAGLEVVRGVTVLSAEEAAQALVEAPDAHDAWLTLDPVPDLEAVRAAVAVGARPPEPSDDVTPIASSTLAVLVAGEDDPGLGCDDPITWGCLSGEARRPPVGVPDPRTALGSVVLGHATAGLLGTADVGIDDVTGEVEGRLGTLLAAAEGPTSRQARAILQPARFTAVVTSEALAGATAATRQGDQRDLRALSLAGAPTVGVVVAPWAGADPSAAARVAEAVLDADSDQTVRDALDAAGWDGAPERSTDLPDPDVIYALQEELAR